MQQFNHHLLCLARDAREFTQAGLAQKMNITQGTQSKYEAGLLLPSDEVLKQLSEALQFPVSFFLQPEQPYGFPPFHFRKRKKLGTKALNRIIAEMNICRMHVKRLCVSYERGEVGFIPEIDADQYQGFSKRRSAIDNRIPAIDDIAQHVREAWGVPAGPIENMVALIERNGGIVVPCAFGTDLIDAMSQRIDGMPVLFFVNKAAPADRVRYTLAHELGHMILHTLSLSDDDTMEDQADAFAGAFLLPAEEVRPQLRRFDLAHLANLKAYWKVSMGALAMRADRLNLISAHQKKMFWIQMGQLDYRKNEPNEPAGEIPEAMTRMLQFHRNELGYSETDIAALLHLNVADFRKLYGEAVLLRRTITTPRLRLVK
jgi:Zn-dependent peptidase ImmA (M78 family)/transcriptional regulator with XRE-family HTH domain